MKKIFKLQKIFESLQKKESKIPKKPKHPLYTQVKFDPDDIEMKILNILPKTEINKPNGQNKEKEAHITLKFKPSINDLKEFEKLNGRSVLVKITNFLILKNGNLACIICKIGKNPKNYHITYICKNHYTKNGIQKKFKPVDSNKLVEAWESGKTRSIL